MLLLALTVSSLACDPIDYELQQVWPEDAQVVSEAAEPLVYVSASGPDVDLGLRLGDDALIPGSVTSVGTADGWSELLRFVPDEPLPPGDYTLLVDVAGEEERDSEHAFTVSADEPTLPALAVRDLEIILEGTYPGDTCDERPRHELSLDFAWPDAAQTERVAVSLHRADSAAGPIADAALGVWIGRPFESGITASFHTEDEPPFCFAVKSWGTHADGDAVSEIVCTDEDGNGGGGGGETTAGCTCTSSASSPLGVGLAGLLLLGLGLLRRRD